MKSIIKIVFISTTVLLSSALWAAPVTIDYTYDDLNRLTTVARSDGATSAYTYDEVSNITTRASTPASIDTDGDGIIDSADNCTNVANPDQRDTDGDNYGNICDPDLNNDGVINFVDQGLMKAVFFSTDPNADLNGDGVVNSSDVGILKSMFFQSPGPSGFVP